MRKYRFFIALFLALPIGLAAQTSSNENIFTISVAEPTLPKDVQVRYVLSGDPAIQQSASIAKPDDNRIVVKTGVEGKPARGFRAIVYAPGCQFVTISADDLAASIRQSDFECQKLSNTTLHGKADISRFSGKQLEVHALYMCRWAGQFFGVPNLAISPISLGKAKVTEDGTFSLDLPDFSADPSWANLSHNATLALVLVDPANGEQLARLSAPKELARGGSLKIAATYPAQIEFGVR